MVFELGAVVDTVIVRVEQGVVTDGETIQDRGLTWRVIPLWGRTERLTFPPKPFWLVSVIAEEVDEPA
jgi:hypothetical protein